MNPQLAQVDIMKGEYGQSRVDFHGPVLDPGLDQSLAQECVPAFSEMSLKRIQFASHPGPAAGQSCGQTISAVHRSVEIKSFVVCHRGVNLHSSGWPGENHPAMVFAILFSSYDHGLASSSIHDLNSDLITLCTSGKSDKQAAQCIADGQAVTSYSGKRAYLTGLARGLVHCPYKTCTISTPGFPVVAPGFTERLRPDGGKILDF